MGFLDKYKLVPVKKISTSRRPMATILPLSTNLIQTPVVWNGRRIHGYGVHKHTGLIYSSKRGDGWRPMSPGCGTSGYPQCGIRIDGKTTTVQVHVIAHETLNPGLPRPEGIRYADWRKTPVAVRALCRHLFQVNHINHNRKDFRPSNLEWTTAEQNRQAARVHYGHA